MKIVNNEEIIKKWIEYERFNQWLSKCNEVMNLFWIFFQVELCNILFLGLLIDVALCVLKWVIIIFQVNSWSKCCSQIIKN